MAPTTLNGWLLAGLMVLGGGGAIPAQSPAVPAVPEAIAAARNDIAGLRLETALGRLDALLERADLLPAQRFETLVLRSQLHVALGALDRADDDYRRLLAADASFTPDPAFTPSKALARFEALRARLVGRLELVVDPPDAQLAIDGRRVDLAPDGIVPLLAGAHALRLERAGHDPLDQTVAIAAGATERVALQLVPNARTVVLTTEPEGVEVRVDGQLVGVTARRPSTLGGSGPAELTLDELPLGEHLFELAKPCFRGERRRVLLAADLLDRAPLRPDVVTLAPSAAWVKPREGPPGAELRIDGSLVGTLPVERVETCPGRRVVELRARERILFGAVEEIAEGEERELAVRPRPNLALIGASSWPPDLEAFARGFTVTAGIELPRDADLHLARAWEAVALPAGTDLAVAILPGTVPGSPSRRLLHSPLLGLVSPLELSPGTAERPVWETASWGLRTVDSTFGGPALVVAVTEGGPAALAGLTRGSRILEIDGIAIASSAALRSRLAGVRPDAVSTVRWIAPDGATQQGSLRALSAPRLPEEVPGPELGSVLAAWAATDAWAGTAGAVAARSNLAWLLGAYGRHDLALATWKGVVWEERAGIGAGTVSYFIGQELEQLGREREAIEAYRLAARSRATAFDDSGPPIAPAAQDRLTDLGQTTGP